MLAWEKNVLTKCTRVITRSQWAIDLLVNQYGVPREKIVLVQAASSLPERIVPGTIDPGTPDLKSVKLLLVGRVYKLKGIDIAIDAVNQLNQQGIPAELRIVGLSGEDSEHVRFMGSYRKSVESELQAYTSQYSWAHFLIHPARYDSAPIVTAEAAAFGVPTLTNAAGGIATTVQDGISGVVLPHLSPAEEYVRVIRRFRENPQQYTALRVSTRERYEHELNWNAVGHRVSEIIRKVVEADQTNKNRSGLL
jgi:glycosyltransferase involved in cell wall biosynthesis